MSRSKLLVAWPLLLDSIRYLEDRRATEIKLFDPDSTLRQFPANEVLMLIVDSSWIEMDNKQVLAIGGVRCVCQMSPRGSPSNSGQRSEGE